MNKIDPNGPAAEAAGAVPDCPPLSCPVLWPRAIALVDMDAFFASVEQRDFPELRGEPVAITNGLEGTTIITRSYEARSYGIKTGMSIHEAKKLCPALIQRGTRPNVYANISSEIMHALYAVSPDVEVFSVDEAFLDITACQKLHGTPARMGQMVREIVYRVSGLPCSVGVAGDKSTAKLAAKLAKPDGLMVIPPWETKARLKDIPVTMLSGIAQGIGSFLAEHGVHTCGQMHQLPVSVLARRFGNLGRRIWLMCQGEDPDKIHVDVAPPKSMGHGKVLPPKTSDATVLRTYLLHMSEKLGARLRRHDMVAGKFFIGLHMTAGWIGTKPQLEIPTNDGREIYHLCVAVFDAMWHGEAVRQVQVTAMDPQHQSGQIDLFTRQDARRTHANAVVDAINDRYGEFVLAPGRLLTRTTTPNVIAPAWKPFGHRKTV